MIRIVLAVMAAAAAALSYRLLVGRPCRVVPQVVGSERRVEGAASVPALTTVLSMLEVAMRQGASVPQALRAIGNIVGGGLGDALCRAAWSLRQGHVWQDAWKVAIPEVRRKHGGCRFFAGMGKDAHAHRRADVDARRHAGSLPGTGKADEMFPVCAGPDGCGEDVSRMIDAIRDALADSWNRGVSPIGRLEAAIDQADAVERAAIEQGAARLSVRLLLPTGLCFLPAFLFLAVIPSIVSLVM